ncbi:hypothetical protein NIF40_06405 [[Clostridium] leptum]|nr:hypothetical protein [[Clostridium] leptum]
MTIGQTLQTILEVLVILGIGMGFLFEQRVVWFERRMLRRWKHFCRRFRVSKNRSTHIQRPRVSKRAA